MFYGDNKLLSALGRAESRNLRTFHHLLVDGDRYPIPFTTDICRIRKSTVKFMVDLNSGC
jgi:hypothetical protein